MNLHIQNNGGLSGSIGRSVGGAVRYVTSVARGEARGLVAAVYDQIAREFALVPPLTLHAPVPEILAGIWCLSREAFVVGRAGRARREMVAAAVSRTNQCPYCVEVHTAMLHAAGEHGLAASLLTGEGAVSAAHGNPLVEWGLATRNPQSALLVHPPFAREEAQQILGTAVTFHFINRMVNIFLDETAMPVGFQSNVLRALIGRLFGMTLGKRIFRVDAAPGQSLMLLPDAPLPPEFGWARRNAPVAGALARMTHAIETQGEAALPTSAIRLARGYLAGWNGEDPGMSSQWPEDAIAPLAGDAAGASGGAGLLSRRCPYRRRIPAIFPHAAATHRRHGLGKLRYRAPAFPLAFRFNDRGRATTGAIT
ncbi:MAG TPA: carboxymuconolactone decarboxylase family protein [Methylocella sp.]|nr:carboxymuconolactone decarboxylase family protein [Methylocella sp.]